MKKKLVGILVILFLFSCNDKIALYSGHVRSVEGDTIKNAQVIVVRNGNILENESDTLTSETIKKINEGKMIKKIESDSLGSIKIAFEDTYFLNPDNIYLLVSKDGYDTAKVKIKWEASTNNIITLHPLQK